MVSFWDTVWVTGTSTSGTVGDWAVADPEAEPENKGGFRAQDKLTTAMIIALFTDAKLPDYLVDEYRFIGSDVQEWHGNTFGIEEGEEPLGSLLWTLERLPMTEDTAKLAEHYATAALQPLVRQKLASSFDVSVAYDKVLGRMDLKITAYGNEERVFFTDLWSLR